MTFTRLLGSGFAAVALPLLAANEPSAIPINLTGSLDLPGAPELRWRVQTESASPEGTETGQTLSATLNGDGVALTARLKLDGALRRGTWELPPTSVDLARWLNPVATRFFPHAPLGDFSIVGILQIGGTGSIAAGRIAGEGSIALVDANVSSVSRAMSVTGLSLQTVLSSLEPASSPERQSLVFREASVANVNARDGEILFTILDNKRVRIDRALMKVFGGTIELGPVVLDLEALAENPVEGLIKISNVGLAEIASLLPAVIAEAHGKLSGEIGVRWSSQNGFKLGNGSLRIERIESVEVRLTPKPGFLTDRSPERLTLLPAWTGPLARWFAPKNPAHETLRQIELGLMSLKVESLDAQIRPNGDAAGRTAHVLVSARPSQQSAVELVNFEINVSGPLDEVMKLGFGENVSISAGK